MQSSLIPATLKKQIEIYRLKSAKLKGCMYATYESGYLVQLDMQLNEPLTASQATFLFSAFPYTVEAIKSLRSGGLQAEPVKMKSIQEKLAAFCSYYKRHRQVPYKASPLERANIKDVPVDEVLLTYFFTSKAWFTVNNYSLTNYIKRINLIRDAARNGLETAVTFPNHYDQKFADSLEKDELARYQAHLRAQGFEYKQTGSGAFVWQRKPVTNSQ